MLQDVCLTVGRSIPDHLSGCHRVDPRVQLPEEMVGFEEN